MKGDKANNKQKLLVALLTTLTLTATCLAAPHGGRGAPDRRGGPPARQVQTRTQMRPAARPAPAPARHANPRPAPVRHAAPRHLPPPRARHVPPPRGRFDRHHPPVGTRFWARPHHCPPPRFGALRAWTWVVAEWAMYINGIYCYGDGYYFDGCTYFYNGAYYTQPPVLVAPTGVYW